MHHIRADVVYIPPDDVPIFVYLNELLLYGQVASLTLLVYDSITTMDNEIKYFWRSSGKKVPTLIYFLNRYVGIFGVTVGLLVNTFHMNGNLCDFTVWAKSLADLLNILLIDYILYMRVIALFSYSSGFEVIKRCLKTLFAIEAAFMFGDLVYCIIYEQVYVGVLPSNLAGCNAERGIPILWGSLFWAAPAAYELVLMVLALYKAAYYWKEAAGFSGFHLTRVLIQDQALYFILVIMCSVDSIIRYWANGTGSLWTSYLEVLFGSATLPCILGSRLLVHLREANERGGNEGTSYRTENMSNVVFA